MARNQNYGSRNIKKKKKKITNSDKFDIYYDYSQNNTNYLALFLSTHQHLRSSIITLYVI